MSLFDGQPLTETEVAIRARCECTHMFAHHARGSACRHCPCEEFREQLVAEGEEA